DYIIEIDHWIAFILLAIIGIKMIFESRKKDCEKNINPLNLWINLGMGIATSIDALIVGVSFALFELNIVLAVFIIGSVTFLAAMLGVLFGKKTGIKFGKKMEIAGGILLILIGFKILVEHLFLI
ncbi:manganese efflux pump MntP family protein, partial [Bacteroidota bacterium]